MSNKPSKNVKNGPPKKSKSVFREYGEAILVAFILALFIRTFFVQAFKIPSGSMQDTLLIGDHILVTKFTYGIHIPNEIPLTSIRLFGDYFFFPEVPQRYDIIVFKYPRDESRDFIKRVIGLPGETIEVRRQEVFINGKKLDDPAANHTIPPSSAPDDPRHNLAPVRIPEGHVFVLGDNRENSQDSRYWGVLDIRKIRGKAQRIYWSWKAKPEMCWICGSVRWDRLGQALE